MTLAWGVFAKLRRKASGYPKVWARPARFAWDRFVHGGISIPTLFGIHHPVEPRGFERGEIYDPHSKTVVSPASHWIAPKCLAEFLKAGSRQTVETMLETTSGHCCYSRNNCQQLFLMFGFICEEIV